MSSRFAKARSEAPQTPKRAPLASTKTIVASVDRAILVLDAFKAGGYSMSLNDLVEVTGLSGNTIQRLLQTLESRRYIRRLEDGRYRLGSILLTMGMIYQRSFRLEDYVLPVLHRLVQMSQESATLSVVDKEELLVLMRVNSPRPVREDFAPGDRMPTTFGAAGSVLRNFADGTRTPSEAFRNLPAVVVGEINPDVGAIAVPFFNPHGDLIGAISVSGPKSRFSAPIVDRLRKLLMDEIVQLSVATGADPSVYRQSRSASKHS